MGEIVLSNKQTTKIDGEIVSAEEKAEFLVKNNYPLPDGIDDFDELVAMIQKKMDEENGTNENTGISRKT